MFMLTHTNYYWILKQRSIEINNFEYFHNDNSASVFL